MSHNKKTDHLIRFVTDTDFSKLPEGIIDASKRCFMDWFGVALGGMEESAVKIVLDLVKSTGGREQAAIPGYGIRTSVLNCALVNGTMAHALDYDDAHMYTRSHLSAPLIAALMPVSQYKNIHGSELVAAFVVGFEVGSRIGLALGNSYYDKGWHSTSILGRFAAAAGVGKLLGLSESKLNHAFGLAATQAGGIRETFGTMSKPFHSGKAAMDGILSVLLADQGFTSCMDILDSRSGFGSLFSTKYDPDLLTRNLGERFNLEDVSLKPYAACLALHPPITGLVSIAREHSLDAEVVERIVLRVAPICVVLGDNPSPESALEGKFSIYFCSALA
ncbi:MAG: MmgE/PrpD family protein, partial [Deltaproteobacteria bacterium]|nr:MmgE/PrpD family protein [Deltaproteobacteria bacterium]